MFYRLVKPGPPEPPSFVTNIAVDATSVHLEWMAGFDGGYEQQFQVQVFDASTMKQVRPLRIQLLCIRSGNILYNKYYSVSINVEILILTNNSI